MKKYIIAFALLIISMSTQAQFFHSIELNNGIAVNSLTDNNLNYEIDPVSLEQLYFTGLSSAISVKYLNHNYWNLSSQLGYLEIGQKTKREGFEYITNNPVTSYNIFYFNMVSFNSMIEIKYPNKFITPSLKFGPRIDYTYSEISVYDQLNKFNYGLALGGGLNYQFKGHFSLNLGYIYNWYAKDLVSEGLTLATSHTVATNNIAIKRSMSIMVGFGYTF